MSTQDLTPAPSNEGENTPAKKPSLRARLKARRMAYAEKHPLRAAVAGEALKGVAYATAATATFLAIGALASLSSNDSSDDEADEIELDDEDE